MRAMVPLILIVCFLVPAVGGEATEAPERRSVVLLPEFDEPRESRWINTKPLTVDDLAGRVVMVEFWTSSCVNCIRSHPWVQELQSRYEKRGLTILGIHTPEFEYENDLERLRKYVVDEGVTYPNLIDNEHRYWNKLENRYWPAFYLVDRQGKLRHLQIGETHSGTESARGFEQVLERLLAEPVPDGSP